MKDLGDLAGTEMPCHHCEHTELAHMHLRPGTDCSVCGCRAYAPSPSRRRLAVAAVIVVAVLAAAAVVMLVSAARAGIIDARPAAGPARAELVVREVFCQRGYHRVARHHRYVCVKNGKTS